MLSLRMWLEPKRLISLRQFSFRATSDVLALLEQGQGPWDVGSLLIFLAQRLTERIEPVLENAELLADDLEERVLKGETGRERRALLGEVRRQVIALRRYLAPQRVALLDAAKLAVPWLEDEQREELKGLADRTTRIVEDLGALRERTAVIKDELQSLLSDQLNTRLYVLSLITAIFLPLSFVTGLLGINVGGMPGAENPAAFWLVTGGLTSLGLVLVLLFRRLRWL